MIDREQEQKTDLLGFFAVLQRHITDTNLLFSSLHSPDERSLDRSSAGRASILCGVLIPFVHITPFVSVCTYVG